MICNNCGIAFDSDDNTLCSRDCGQAFWEKKQGVLKLTGKENMVRLHALGYKESTLHKGFLEVIELGVTP